SAARRRRSHVPGRRAPPCPTRGRTPPARSPPAPPPQPYDRHARPHAGTGSAAPRTPVHSRSRSHAAARHRSPAAAARPIRPREFRKAAVTSLEQSRALHVHLAFGRVRLPVRLDDQPETTVHVRVLTHDLADLVGRVVV